MSATPATLLERLRQGSDPAAWPRFVELYAPLLYSWARRTGMGDDDAADVVQDVFAQLLVKLPAFVYDPRRSFRSWLKAVLLNHWRTRRRRRNVPIDPAADPDGLAAPGIEGFWEAEYRQRLVGRALEVMRAEFQPATWKACWEAVVNGRPAEEVGLELGLTPNAVRVAKFRVLSRLRRELAGLAD
jgi:RNA polymerase sigma-70 factor (ECF subfamily)